jgi:hypothetical protein
MISDLKAIRVNFEDTAGAAQVKRDVPSILFLFITGVQDHDHLNLGFSSSSL